MGSRWASFGQVIVYATMHRDRKPLDGPTSYPVLDKSDPNCKVGALEMRLRNH